MSHAPSCTASNIPGAQRNVNLENLENSVSGNVRKCPVFSDELNARQLRAIRLLVAGRKEVEVARELGIDARTLHRWRTLHPRFRAELAARRGALWHNSADHLRALMPRALKILSRQMTSNYDITSYRAAVSLLRLAGAHKMVAPPEDPTDPLDVVREDLRRERARDGDPAAADAPVTPEELFRKFNELLAECAADNPQPEYQI